MELTPRRPLPSAESKRDFVRAMFDRIAPRYDLMNRLMTLGLDQRWRSQALDAVSVGPGDRVLDLATGTGDLAELARARGARVVGVDLALEMLRAARRRCAQGRVVRADAVALPLPDASFDVVTCGFGLRNFCELEAVLHECARVLAPGGRLVLLEVDEPRSRIARWGHGLHFRHVVPWLGALVSDGTAYRYLPASASYLPEERELRRRIEAAGFDRVRKRRHLLGVAQELSAVRVPA
ncbi:MAG: ubiquinone/menaquinone biosynthesis methyltransferase [Myxococcota bacterium]